MRVSNTPIVDNSGGATEYVVVGSTPGQVISDFSRSLQAKYLSPTGALETYPRSNGVANLGALTSGTVAFSAIALPKGQLITNLTFRSVTTAMVTPTNWWFAICDSAGLQLARTADQLTAAWGANTTMTLPLTSPLTTTYEGLYYLVVMVAAATVPSLGGVSVAGSAADAPRVNGTGLTGQTVPSANGTNLLPAPGNLNATLYAYVT